jgi:hypothetical protein
MWQYEIWHAGKFEYPIERGYNDIGLCDTSVIASDDLWCQLIPHF